MFHRSRSSSPSPLLINTKPTPRAGRRGYITFFATAVLTGVVFHLLFIGFGGNDAVRDVPVLKDWIPPAKTPAVKVIYEACPDVGTFDPIHTATARPAKVTPRPDGDVSVSLPTKSTTSSSNEQPIDLEALRAMVAKTKGYYGRDFSLGLGWNNVRYIIEAAMVQASLLNRTLVLPSFVYARSCEWGIHACAAFAPMVNRGDAIGWGEWRDLPIEKQMGWRVPMDVMLDIPHLRKTHSVLLLTEYLQLHGIDPQREWSNGAWHRTDYLGGDDDHKMTIHVVKNGEYDPSDVFRVDNKKLLLSKEVSAHEGGPMESKLSAALAVKGNGAVLDWSEAKMALADWLTDSRDDAELEKLLGQNGWAVLHTFAGALGMDYLKSVVEPIKQAAPLNRIKGWVDDYDHITADILVLEGETHLGRKPGGMRFTTVEGRDNFARDVLYGLQPIGKVRDLADKVYDRMLQKVDGRMWMAGHMRRGDFVTQGWAMEGSVQAHFDRIKGRLVNGRAVLERITQDQKLEPFLVPDVVLDQTQLTLSPPREGDPFFLATDERTDEGIKYIKEHGAVLIGDLITIEDRRDFGWGIMLTDVLALVEQAVLSKAYYFYAHAMSSVAGGAVNMRAARGADRRSTLID